MAAAPAFMAAGFALNAYGQLQSSWAQSAAYKDQARQAMLNAQDAKEQAIVQAEQQAIESKKIIAETTSDYAAAGVEGQSVYAVLADSMTNAEMDRLSILYGGDIRSRNFQAEASSYRKAASAAETSGIFGALSGGFMAAGSMGKR